MCRYLIETHHCGCVTGPTFSKPCPVFEVDRNHWWADHPTGDAPGRPEICQPSHRNIWRQTSSENCPNGCARPGEEEVRHRLSIIHEESARTAASEQDVVHEEPEHVPTIEEVAEDDEDRGTVFEEDDDWVPPLSPAQATVGSVCSQDSSECSQDSSSSCSQESDDIPIAISNSVREAVRRSRNPQPQSYRDATIFETEVAESRPRVPQRAARARRPEMAQRRPSPILNAYFGRPEERRSSRRRSRRLEGA
ncbi:hypothetical protein MBLNU457_g2574t3 [Dothideomycetes sp. NU457]